MKRVKFALVLAIVILAPVIFAVIHTWPSARFGSNLFAANIGSEQTIDVNGVSRTFFVHVPPSYKGDTAVPLVFALHGRGGTAAMAERREGWDNVADKNGFVVVYPQALGDPAAWNVGYMHDYVTYDDMAFFRTLLALMQKTYKIDSNRIYFTGFSSGGMMSFRVGAEMSDVLAAIGPVSGSEGPQREDLFAPWVPKTPISIIAIHGEKDDIVPYSGGWDVPPPTYINDWAKADHCNLTPTATTSKDGNIVTSSYTGGTNKTDAVLISVADGIHWFPKWAPDTIWKFFAAHPKIN